MAKLRTHNVRLRRKRLWEWWRPRFDAGDFNAFLMSLDWKSKSARYFRTPKPFGQEGSSPADGALGRRDRSVHAQPLNPSETNHG